MTERALLDTNVLVYALYEQDEHHTASAALLQRAQQPAAAYCLTPQSVAEFYAVVTDRRRVTVAKPPAEALAALANILSLPGLTLLPVPVDVVARLTDLLYRRPVIGRDVFDVQLIATMLGNGVRKIYTFNTGDFEPFDEIEVVRPMTPDR